jgi:hypothetical protein
LGERGDYAFLAVKAAFAATNQAQFEDTASALFRLLKTGGAHTSPTRESMFFSS